MEACATWTSNGMGVQRDWLQSCQSFSSSWDLDRNADARQCAHTTLIQHGGSLLMPGNVPEDDLYAITDLKQDHRLPHVSPQRFGIQIELRKS